MTCYYVVAYGVSLAVIGRIDKRIRVGIARVKADIADFLYRLGVAGVIIRIDKACSAYSIDDFLDAITGRVVLVLGYARRLRRAVIIQFSKSVFLYKSEIAGCFGPAICQLKSVACFSIT